MAHLNISHYWKIAIVSFVCCQIVFAEHVKRPEKSRVSIVGGTVAKESAWPYLAVIISPESHLCGGTIIASRWILTASHCLEDSDDASLYQVMVGKNDITDIYEEDIITPEQVIKHPDYITAELGDDIALIYLREPLTYSTKVKQASLVTADPAPGTKCTVIGFGTTQFEGEASNQLLQVDVPVVSNEDCGYGLGQSMFDSQICAGEAGKDSCQGDSGGPLLCKNANQKFDVIGVVSYGTGCGEEGQAGVYARVSSYLPWISETMKSLPN